MGNTKHGRQIIDADAHFTIDPVTRNITNNTPEKNTILQGDHNSERFTFKIPRYIDGHDMLTCNNVRVPYINAEVSGRDKKHATGSYLVADLELDPTNDKFVTCSWLISKNATGYAGVLNFAIVFSCMEDAIVSYRWKTNIFESIYIAPDLDTNMVLEAEYLDVIEQWKDSVKNEFSEYLEASAEQHYGEFKTVLHGEMMAEFEVMQDSLDASFKAQSDSLDEVIDGFDEILRTEITNMDSEIYLLETRMDTFASLPNGTTSGNAELLDIRIGADGTTYASAGRAVRSQIESLVKSSHRRYRFDIGGIANTLGTVSANRSRIRTVLPYLEPKFTITKFNLPDDVQKATVLGLKNDAFVADLFTSLTISDEAISFNLNTPGIDIDSIGITFQHSNGSDFTIEEASESYVEYRVSAGKIDKFARTTAANTMISGKFKRGVVGTNGVLTSNNVALSTEYIKCNSDEFVLVGPDEYLLLRCVGRNSLGNYSVLDVYPEEGGYRVNTENVEAIAFSFYKGIANGSHIVITDEEYETASFSYSTSFDNIKTYISDIANELRTNITNVEQRITSAKGSKLVAIGDSITYGFIPRNAPGYPGQLNSYAALTAEYYNMDFVNCGISGSTVAHVEGRSPMCERIADLPDDADIITVMGGTNDIRNGVNLGTMSDRTSETFYGALHVMMSALYEKYMVKQFGQDGKRAKIIICTPIKLLDASSSKQNETDGKLVALEPWVDAVKEVANYYSFPVLDFYNLSGINPHIHRIVKGTDVDYNGYYNPYITDGTHPTNEGAMLMAECLISFLKTIC